MRERERKKTERVSGGKEVKEGKGVDEGKLRGEDAVMSKTKWREEKGRSTGGKNEELRIHIFGTLDAYS